MRAIVLGTQSFIDGGTKVGSQYLAQALGSAGWEVDYVPTLSSPVDVIGRQRHARLGRAWAGGGVPVPVGQGVVEWSARAPFPAHRWFLRQGWQVNFYGALLPEQLRQTRFDVCLADVAPNLLLLQHVNARVKVCRLNDWPWGFAQDLHPVVVSALESTLRDALFDEVWAVSLPLLEYAQKLNSRVPVAWLPNGVDVALLPPQERTPVRRPFSAVYVGGLTAWLDNALLLESARRMQDWTFDIYGPGGRPLPDAPANLRWHGSVDRAALLGVLSSHEVGLIPFQDTDGRMRYVERPLKFYEYLAAGLGVASTDLGGLRQGMGPLACYGNGADGFERAIRCAREEAAARPPGFGAEFVLEHGWPTRAQAMFKRLHALLT